MPGRLVADKQGRYLDADAGALELLGLTLEELRSMQVGDFSGPHAEMARTVWRRLAATGENMTMPGLRRVKGMGPSRLARYGAEVLEIVTTTKR